MTMYNRKKIHAGLKSVVNAAGAAYTQNKVDAINFLLERFESEPLWKDKRHVSYAFATILIETAYTFEPIKEYGGDRYFEGRYGSHTSKGQELGNKFSGDGAKFCGRGYVQLTGGTNYKKADKEIRARFPEILPGVKDRTGKDFNLVLKPEQAKDPNVAFLIMTLGMFEGWFTGHTLAKHINSSKTDYKNARRIINGTDKNVLIASYATSIEKALTQTGVVQPTSSVEPVKPQETVPVIEQEEIPEVKEPTVTESTPEAYNEIGLQATIVKDARAVGGGLLGLGSIKELGEYFSGFTVSELYLYVAIGLIVLFIIGYFIFRIVHYLVDAWRKTNRSLLQAEMNARHDTRNLEWVESEAQKVPRSTIAKL